MRPVTRVDPKLPVGAMQTYQILAPAPTHFRPATCAEADCGNYRHGWVTQIDELTDQGKLQAWWIRNRSGRSFREDRDAAPGLTVFTFEAGQTCFYRLGEPLDPARPHQVRIDRPEIFLVRGGDWRGHTGDVRRHTSPADWVDDFGEHQLRLADKVERG
jgi:hypothetical protein